MIIVVRPNKFLDFKVPTTTEVLGQMDVDNKEIAEAERGEVLEEDTADG